MRAAEMNTDLLYGVIGAIAKRVQERARRLQRAYREVTASPMGDNYFLELESEGDERHYTADVYISYLE